MEFIKRIKNKLMPEEDPLKYFIGAGILFYVFLCVLHFASGRPPWLDERSILMNLEVLTPGEIFGALRQSQAFPRVYFLALYGISRISDHNIYALRALPFVFMLSAFFLWLRIFIKEEGRKLSYLLFILSCCGSYFMSYYSAELKQFSGDVFVCAFFAYFIIKQRDYLKREKIEYSLIAKYLLMPALVLVSYPAYYFVLIPLYNLILSVKDNRKNILYAFIYFASFLFFLYISYNFDVRYTRTAEELPYYWNDYFILVSSFPEFIQSFSEGLRNIFARWFLEISLVRRIATIFMPFALYYLIVSGVKRFREEKGLLISLNTIIPAVITGMAIAGLLKAYPFTGTRVTLFIAPFIFYSIIKGIELLKDRFYWAYTALTTFYILTLISTSMYLLRKYLLLY